MHLTIRARRARAWSLVVLGFAAVAGVTVLLLALLTNIFERKAGGPSAASCAWSR